MIIEKKRFGTADGTPVLKFRIRNKNGMVLSLISLGAAMTGLTAPDRNGNFGDVLLGYDDLDGYLANDGYLGACVGRYANRIGGAGFELGGREYHTTANEGRNTLHGGRGWSKRVFECHPGADSVEFCLTDREGADGFPGNLTVRVKYTLGDNNSVEIDYLAVSDSDTVLNITNHGYYNLACGGNVLNHQLRVAADYYTPVDSELIPTGEILPVEGTDFDFRTLRRIGNGFYDHNYVLRDENPGVVVYDSGSGRKMEVETDMPGVQIYCSGMLTDRLGKHGARYGRYSGLCLETQFFPDSPNVPQFPSAELKAWEEYRRRTVYRFSAE